MRVAFGRLGRAVASGALILAGGQACPRDGVGIARKAGQIDTQFGHDALRHLKTHAGDFIETFEFIRLVERRHIRFNLAVEPVELGRQVINMFQVQTQQQSMMRLDMTG